ncbi:MAG: PD-(D/E)XK nuclease family protein, partial [Bacteroidota bacterium]
MSIHNLLDKLEILDFKYEKIKEKESFNIFSLLRNYSDEVNLHSKFISELLDIKGSHAQGSKFSQAFIEKFQISFDFEQYSTFTEYKNIDILLNNRKQAVVIENKIWAEDQDRQLERYHEIMKNEGYQEIIIIYLTLDGKEPDQKSLGKLKLDKDVHLISYSYDVYNWIERCIEISSRNPTLRETLIQYQTIIKELTGKTMKDDQTQEVIDLLSENDNILKAQLIAKNWVHVKWHTEFKFWNDFLDIISSEYEVLPVQRFSSENLDSVIHKIRNRNPWYGIMFKIGEFNDADVCLFIERSFAEL